MSVTLAAGGWEAELRPDLGGSIAALRRDGVDVLRPLPTDSRNVLDGSCFPLVPYCNRIAEGRFSWQGRPVQMPHNFAPETSSLHGLGWQAAWEVARADSFRCTLVHHHPGLGPAPWKGAVETWPWAYRAEQRVRLGAQGCKITLDLTNLSNVPMPAGLGLHPYFRRTAQTRVRFAAKGMVQVDDRLIPTADFVAADSFAPWGEGTELPGGLVDHCFTGWNGEVAIADELGTITLKARGAPDLHVYSPADGSALCFEPVSHIPDALNQDPAGMIALPPGCTASLEMEITAKG